MSLINDALKKAQQQRTQDAPAAPPQHAIEPSPIAPHLPPGAQSTPVVPQRARIGSPPVTPSASSPPSAVRYAAVDPASTQPAGSSQFLWLGLGAMGLAAAVIAVAVGVTIMVMHHDAEPLAPPAKTVEALPAPRPITKSTPPAHAETKQSAEPVAVAATPVETPAPSATVSLPSTTPAAAASPTPTPAIPVVSVTPAPPAVEPEPAAPIVSAPPTPSNPLPSVYAPRAPAAVNPSLRIQNFLDRLRVAGIRISSTGNKVILNDRLFMVNEVVDSGLGLRLVKIEQGTLTFVDAQGKTYLKLFQ